VPVWCDRSNTCRPTLLTSMGFCVWGRLLCAGGADGAVVVWHDSTMQDAAAAAEEEDLVFEREQALSNALAVRLSVRVGAA